MSLLDEKSEEGSGGNSDSGTDAGQLPETTSNVLDETKPSEGKDHNYFWIFHLNLQSFYSIYQKITISVYIKVSNNVGSDSKVLGYRCQVLQKVLATCDKKLSFINLVSGNKYLIDSEL